MNGTAQQSTVLLPRPPFVHPTADIRGSVAIGRGCWFGPNVRLYADHGRIVIGENTTIEAECRVRAGNSRPTIIGEWVRIGAASRIENATIKNGSVIGKGCILSTGTVVGESALLGDGTVTSPGQVIPNRAIAKGLRGRVLGTRLEEAWRASSNRGRRHRDGAPATAGADTTPQTFSREVDEPLRFSAGETRFLVGVA